MTRALSAGGRALRRHHRARMIKKARAVLAARFGYWGERNRDLNAKRLADNITSCSCWMCGNPRRVPGRHASRLTIQELKHEEKSHDDG